MLLITVPLSIKYLFVQYVERSIESLDWITLTMVGCFVLFAIARVLYPKHFDDFIKLHISRKYFSAKGLLEDINHPFTILLFIFQVLTISLFIFLFFPEVSKINSWLYLQIATGVFVFIISKLFLEKLIGTIFSIDWIIDQYVYQKLTYKNYFSIILFFANLIFYYIYSPNLTTLLVFTGCISLFYSLILFYIYNSYRSLLFSNFFYFILYLCTLEISPYVILYKALV